MFFRRLALMALMMLINWEMKANAALSGFYVIDASAYSNSSGCSYTCQSTYSYPYDSSSISNLSINWDDNFVSVMFPRRNNGVQYCICFNSSAYNSIIAYISQKRCNITGGYGGPYTSAYISLHTNGTIDLLTEIYGCRCYGDYYLASGNVCRECPSAPSSYSSNTKILHENTNTSPAGITGCYIPVGATGSDSKGSFKVSETCYYFGS